MSLLNRADTGKPKKSVGGVDSSMITRMKREQAIVSSVRVEPDARTRVSFAITSGPSSGAANRLTYTFPAQSTPPFVVGEVVNVSENTASVSGTVVPSIPTSTAGVTASAVTLATGAAPTYVTLSSLTMPTTSVPITVGTVLSITGTPFGGLVVGAYIVTQIYDAVNRYVVLSSYTIGTGISATQWTPSAATGTMNAKVNRVTLTFTAATTTQTMFAAGDSITVGGNIVGTTGYVGTFTVLATPAPSPTTVSFIALGATGDTTSANAGTITPVPSRYNGTFTITACTNNTVTVSTDYYGTFNTGLTTGNVIGNLPLGTSFTQIRDGMKTRGFTDGPIMPFYARGGSLGFYRVL